MGSELINWEHRAVVALHELHAAVAAELSALARLREAYGRGTPDAIELKREADQAAKAVTAAFAMWEREVRT
jgi:hypothetical protein